MNNYRYQGQKTLAGYRRDAHSGALVLEVPCGDTVEVRLDALEKRLTALEKMLATLARMEPNAAEPD